MREAGIGRVLVASLHQGIADILPTRLTFYENWLNAEGLREGTIGLAPLYAVLSFLRQEGDAYQMITTRAGEYAAEWTVASMSPFQRSMIRATPTWLRGRLLLRLARALVRDSYQRQPRDFAPPPRYRPRRSARVDLLHRSRTGAASPVRVLRGGVYPAARPVQPRGPDRGGGLPRHRQADLRAPDRAAEWTASGGDRVRRLVCAALLLTGTAGSQPALAQSAARPERVLVVPFVSLKRDASIFWLGEASALLLTDNLNARGISAITRPERKQAFERLQIPTSAVLTDATVIRIAQLVGAAQVILGSLQLESDGLVVRARTLAIDEGRIRADVTERGPVADLFTIFDRLAGRLSPSSAASRRRFRRPRPSSRRCRPLRV